ncbi:MAG: hypothetical protein HQL31_03495 [Planctomycetes bacterium]|nr:hypothetical protein [Planctomycetota bacterium]
MAETHPLLMSLINNIQGTLLQTQQSQQLHQQQVDQPKAQQISAEIQQQETSELRQQTVRGGQDVDLTQMDKDHQGGSSGKNKHKKKSLPIDPDDLSQGTGIGLSGGSLINTLA